MVIRDQNPKIPGVKKPKVKKPPGKVVEPEGAKAATGKYVTLSSLYTKKQQWIRFRQWIVGVSPLICHAWSEKAKREMLSKMVKAVRHVKEERDPEQEFTDSLYRLESGGFGFPVTAVKKAIQSQAHKDRGIPKTSVQAGLWMDFEMIQARPAFAGAAGDHDGARYACREHAGEQWTWIQSSDRWTRTDS